MPKSLQVEEEPKLKLEDMFYWNSFWVLGRDRHELGPIPFTAINDYCYRWGMNSVEEYESFLFFIEGMDNKFLEVKGKEIKKERDMGKAKSKSGFMNKK